MFWPIAHTIQQAVIIGLDNGSVLNTHQAIRSTHAIKLSSHFGPVLATNWSRDIPATFLRLASECDSTLQSN